MQNRQRGARWIWRLLFVGLLAGGAYYAWNYTTLPAQIPWLSAQVMTAAAPSAVNAQTELPTVTIQKADLVISQVSASGKIAVVDSRPVVLETSGIVASVDVKVGDAVRRGDVLVTLDTTALERAVRLAELDVESAQNQLAEVTETASASEIAVAEAALLEAQENLADVRQGPSSTEIAAARSALAAAQAAYNELVAGPSQAELTQLAADVKTAEINVAAAQSAYNQVAWKTDAGASTEAAELQSATIALEKARAAYAQSTAAASTSDLQTALSNIQNAQVSLDALLNSPTAAEIATAEAQVAEAQATLDDLLAGPTATEVRSAQITLEQTLVALEEAYAALTAATVTAPTDGVVMSIDAVVGAQLSTGAEVATLADTQQLELTINVSELDIPRVQLGQAAQVEIDALPSETFNGEVTALAPTNDANSTAVVYPVTIQLQALDGKGVMPGMSAVGVLIDETLDAESSWLAPTNSIRQQDGVSVVRVLRNGQLIPVEVTTGAIQGEWTVVQSPELQEGDQVLGSVASYVDRDSNRFPMGGMGIPGAGMGGPPPGN